MSSGPLTYQPHQIADPLDHRSDLRDADALRGRGCLEFAFQAGTFALRLVDPSGNLDGIPPAPKAKQY
ncbi:hypothetical protein GCM10012278_15120 [Nonomuraea glycinis]|uniref:Uncharacterized protein n=1 Tax=Nonomuraea glycinis TaxID=2047744 RepID=A0A918A2N4_9ACTN|nr:hypothetical protein GCM10012278_15120 [Nonomuraea glycinis]